MFRVPIPAVPEPPGASKVPFGPMVRVGLVKALWASTSTTPPLTVVEVALNAPDFTTSRPPVMVVAPAFRVPPVTPTRPPLMAVEPLM